MDKENLAEYLKSIPKPAPPDLPTQKLFKITLLTARRSSKIGILFIAFPALILSAFVLQSLFHVDFGFVRWLGKNALSLSHPVKAMLAFVFLVGFPSIAVVLNLLSLLHFQYDRKGREFHLTFRIRWWNILITLTAGALASYYILRLLADTLLGGK